MTPDARELTRIAFLNDNFRKTFIGGKTLITRGVAALPEQDQADILEKVRTFDAFTEDNDPYREHDFGAFEHNGQKIFWKIDYYDPSMQFGSENPANHEITVRVLTIMLAEEY
jgi:hypothetical protein